MPSAKSRTQFSRLGHPGWSRRSLRSVSQSYPVQCCHISPTYFLVLSGCRGHCEAVQAPGQPLGGHREGTGERHEDTLGFAAGRHFCSNAGEFENKVRWKAVFLYGATKFQALNKCELNLYGRVTLGRQCADQRTLFIFR